MEKMNKEMRNYSRFDKKAKAFLYYKYDFNTKIDLLNCDEVKNSMADKFPACSKNVSVEGICFTSLKELRQGEKIQIDMYLSEEGNPIHMEGEVRWSHQSLKDADSENGSMFDTGVRLLSVDGKSVSDSIYFDESYQVMWSVVLDTILGKFNKLMREKKDNSS